MRFIKFQFLLTLLILINNFSFSQNESYFLTIKQITENIYLHTSFKNISDIKYPSNGIYIVTENNVILFDTPCDEEQTQQLLTHIEETHNLQVTHCIVTHYHDDRNAGLDILKNNNILTYSSISTFDLSIENNEKTSEFCFNNDTIFEIDNLIFETFFPGEGHTKDNITIWFPYNKTLYAGCFIKSINSKNLGYTKDSNLSQWASSIKKLKAKYPEVKYVIPGHYDYGGRELLTHTLNLLKKK